MCDAKKVADENTKNKKLNNDVKEKKKDLVWICLHGDDKVVFLMQNVNLYRVYRFFPRQVKTLYIRQ